MLVAFALGLQVIVEPSGAAGVAAALGSQLSSRHPDLKHVGVILCGKPGPAWAVLAGWQPVSMPGRCSSLEY